jgi:hypothetical protein
MDTSEVVKQGLALVGKESEFRKRAEQWMPGINQRWTFPPTAHPFVEPLEVWPWRAREMAGDKWDAAVYDLFGEIHGYGRDIFAATYWMTIEATPYHWLIAACVAIEMGKKKE